MKKTVSLEELAKHEDQYILLSDDKTKVLASEKTIKELEMQSQKLKIKGGTIEYISPLDKALSLVCL